MAQLGRSQPVPPVISRNSLQDAPVLTTPAPLVIEAAATPRFGMPGQPVISSAPVITAAAPAQATPAPLVVMATALTPWGKPQAAIISEGAPGQITPPPLVIAQPVKMVPPLRPVILRGSLADAPVLTTPPPVVVAAPVRYLPTFPVISAAPLITAAPPVRNATSAPRVTAMDTSSSAVSGAVHGARVAAKATSLPRVSDG